MTTLPASTLDETTFRQVMGHFPTGVVIVAANTDAGDTALTLQSFQSLSLNPRLALISVARTSTSWPAIAAHGSFVATILANDQGQLARTFAKSDNSDKFRGVATEPSPTHAHPIIAGGTAWVECDIETITEAGDHIVVVAAVRAMALLERSKEPILFFASQFASLTPAS